MSSHDKNFSCRMIVVLALLAVACAQAPNSPSFGYIPNGQDSQSQFFYALYPSVNVSAPLVMWLQGGPGGSSFFGGERKWFFPFQSQFCVLGDFLENGPVDVYNTSRATSWTNVATMLCT
jgi:hypothetical protein